MIPNPWILLGFAGALFLTALGAFEFGDTHATNRENARWEKAEKDQANKAVSDIAAINAENATKAQAAKDRIDALEKEALANQAKYDRLGLAYEKIRKAAYADQSPLSPTWRALFGSLLNTQSPGDNPGH